MDIESRKKYIDGKIAHDKHTNEMGEKIANVLDEFDGKILNCKLEKLLKEKCSIHIYVKFNLDIELVEIHYNGSENGRVLYSDSRVFYLRNEALAKTESGKYRLVAEKAKEQIRGQIDSVNNRIEIFEDGKQKIEEIRNEMLEISKTFESFKKKYNGQILEIAGCNYRLNNICGSYPLSDSSFTVY